LIFWRGKREIVSGLVIEWPSAAVQEFKSVRAGSIPCTEGQGLTLTIPWGRDGRQDPIPARRRQLAERVGEPLEIGQGHLGEGFAHPRQKVLDIGPARRRQRISPQIRPL